MKKEQEIETNLRFPSDIVAGVISKSFRRL